MGIDAEGISVSTNQSVYELLIIAYKMLLNQTILFETTCAGTPDL